MIFLHCILLWYIVPMFRMFQDWNPLTSIVRQSPGTPTSLTTAGHHKIGFEDVLLAIREIRRKKDNHYLMLNTLPITEQDYLIEGTTSYTIEEQLINGIMNDVSKDPKTYFILLYGKNCTDDSVDKKYKQMIHLGFSKTFIYYGGLFEWSLLQDIYGAEYFPTTKPCKELLLLAPRPKIMTK